MFKIMKYMTKRVKGVIFYADGVGKLVAKDVKRRKMTDFKSHVLTFRTVFRTEIIL
jgi:hypothetical protein